MAKDRTRTALRPTLISLAVASCFTAGTALANPTGANVVQGTAAIHQAGNLLQITNSPNAIINWQSFSIGANEITRFLQQSASSAVLNRVITQNPSQILGALQSNGRVFLINPNGILFGAGAQIDVGGLVASTLNMSDGDFLAGRMRFGDGLGKSVVNEGSINTGAGGSVYLIGSGVTNSGIIRSPQGEVVLAAGNSVELVSPGTPNLRVEIAASDHEARNLGQIISDAGRIGIYAGLINNSGTIRADSAVSEGGRILLKASKSATLESTSVLSAQGQGGGEIKVLADQSVQVAGRLDASAPNGGDGGFIETSAKNVQVQSGTIVTTSAPEGNTGTWLIDPINFTIAAGGGLLTPSSIGADTLSTSLDATSVVIATVATGIGPGDIFVDAPVSWTANSNLTLLAHNNVNVNQSLSTTGTGTIAMYAGWDGNVTTPNVICCSGSINLMAPVSTAGTAVLVASIDISQNANGAISATNLLAKSAFGNVALGGATNSVGTLAGSSQFGSFAFTNGSSLVIDSVDSGNSAIGIIDGVSAINSFSSFVTINVTSGDLTVNKNVLAGSGNSNQAHITLTAQNNLIANNSIIESLAGAGETSVADASVTLAALTGDVTLNGSAVGARSVRPGCCNPSLNSAVSMTAGGNITLSSSNVIVEGGGGDTGEAGGMAAATLTAGGVIQFTGSVLSVLGGAGGAGFSGQAGASGGAATVTLTGSSISLDGASTINATGGAGGFGGGITGGIGGNGGNAEVALTASSISLSASSTINATGGVGGSGGSGSGFGGGFAAGNGGSGGGATITLTGGSISLSSSNINPFGGMGGAGGSANEGAAGGAGGNGGNATATLTGSSITLTGSTIFVSAAQGGNGGSASSGGVPGNGGNGGSAAVTLAGGSVSVATSSFVGAGGGGGGNGGSNTFGGGAAGNGGNGGSATITLTGDSISLLGGSSIDAFAGFGGAGGGNSSGIGGNGGMGGGASVVALTAGPILVDGGEISAGGGGGGSPGIGPSNGAFGPGGAAMVTLNAGTGGITVQSSSGGGSSCQTGCLVLVDVKATAVSRLGLGVSAIGGDGGTGGAATAMLNTTGNIMVDNSFVFAQGGDAQGTGGNGSVMLTTGGDITLASNVVANGGLGSIGNGAGRIDLVFLSSSGTFSVNGVTDLLFDTITGSGFMVDNMPAILNVNLFVTQGAPVFIDNLVATMNQQADVLADQLKAGDTPGNTEDKEKKKLPFCSS